MIRAGVLPELERTVEVCPACQGNGEIGTRVFGRFAPEPYVWATCGSCSGTGEVDAEAVATCAGCRLVFWVEDVCPHLGVALCVDCRPVGVCRDCVEEAAERVGEYR